MPTLLVTLLLVTLPKEHLLHNMKKIIIAIIISLGLSTNFCLAQTEEAAGPGLQDAFTNVQQTVGERAGYSTEASDPMETVSNMISTVLSFLGILFVLLLIYGGINWMTAGGQETRVADAKKVIKQSLIGIIIILGAYAISYFIIRAFSSLAS